MILNTSLSICQIPKVVYDLDTTGIIMEEIERITAPPSSDAFKVDKKNTAATNYGFRKPRASNHEYCDSCFENGDLICCDKCPASFHLQCCEPPYNEETVPKGFWMCRKCKAYSDMLRESLIKSGIQPKSLGRPKIYNNIYNVGVKQQQQFKNKFLPQSTSDSKPQAMHSPYIDTFGNNYRDSMKDYKLTAINKFPVYKNIFFPNLIAGSNKNIEDCEYSLIFGPIYNKFMENGLDQFKERSQAFIEHLIQLHEDSLATLYKKGMLNQLNHLPLNGKIRDINAIPSNVLQTSTPVHKKMQELLQPFVQLVNQSKLDNPTEFKLPKYFAKNPYPFPGTIKPNPPAKVQLAASSINNNNNVNNSSNVELQLSNSKSLSNVNSTKNNINNINSNSNDHLILHPSQRTSNFNHYHPYAKQYKTKRSNKAINNSINIDSNSSLNLKNSQNIGNNNQKTPIFENFQTPAQQFTNKLPNFSNYSSKTTTPKNGTSTLENMQKVNENGAHSCVASNITKEDTSPFWANGLVKLPPKLCYNCGRSCARQMLIQCDYCPLFFHLDCLTPPLTYVQPNTLWMCPNHPEQLLERKYWSPYNSLVDRIKIWDLVSDATFNKSSGKNQDTRHSVNTFATKIGFLRKTLAKNLSANPQKPYLPPFNKRVRVRTKHTSQIPFSVMQAYNQNSQHIKSILPKPLITTQKENQALNQDKFNTSHLNMTEGLIEERPNFDHINSLFPSHIQPEKISSIESLKNMRPIPSLNSAIPTHLKLLTQRLSIQPPPRSNNLYGLIERLLIGINPYLQNAITNLSYKSCNTKNNYPLGTKTLGTNSLSFQTNVSNNNLNASDCTTVTANMPAISNITIDNKNNKKNNMNISNENSNKNNNNIVSELNIYSKMNGGPSRNFDSLAFFADQGHSHLKFTQFIDDRNANDFTLCTHNYDLPISLNNNYDNNSNSNIKKNSKNQTSNTQHTNVQFPICNGFTPTKDNLQAGERLDFKNELISTTVHLDNNKRAIEISPNSLSPNNKNKKRPKLNHVVAEQNDLFNGNSQSLNNGHIDLDLNIAHSGSESKNLMNNAQNEDNQISSANLSLNIQLLTVDLLNRFLRVHQSDQSFELLPTHEFYIVGSDPECDIAPNTTCQFFSPRHFYLSFNSVSNTHTLRNFSVNGTTILASRFPFNQLIPKNLIDSKNVFDLQQNISQVANDNCLCTISVEHEINTIHNNNNDIDQNRLAELIQQNIKAICLDTLYPYSLEPGDYIKCGCIIFQYGKYVP